MQYLTMHQISNMFLVRLSDTFVAVVSFVVFAIFDLLDQLLCPVFAILDSYFDKNSEPCYCHQTPVVPPYYNKHNQSQGARGDDLSADCEHRTGPSDTLYERKHSGRKNGLHFLALHRSLSGSNKDLAKDVNAGFGDKRIVSREIALAKSVSDNVRSGRTVLRSFKVSRLKSRVRPSRIDSFGATTVSKNVSSERVPVKSRWSDCGCDTCTSWQSRGELLHVYIDGKDATLSKTGLEGIAGNSENNVIFIHGFLSSSSFWAETVLPGLPDSVRSSYRLFAVDLLGFGKSPKPTNCLYTNADHVDMIRRSVIERYGVENYHVVAHSMGCTIALALAGQDPTAVKSITLISPPYFPASPGTSPSSYLLQQVAPRKIWPLIAFGPSVMSWYEHLGRVVCFVVCKNHRIWEPVLLFGFSKLLGRRIPQSFVRDFMQHTHNSAWHIFHNTICSGAYTTEYCMKILERAGRRVRVIHGGNDIMCPLRCSLELSQHYSNVCVTEIPGANHVTVVLGREPELARELQEGIFAADRLLGPKVSSPVEEAPEDEKCEPTWTQRGRAGTVPP